jgi:3',5'-cyclic-AMP phosphodiesterase
MPERQHVLSWLHIGDLHITTAGEENYRDLMRIINLVGYLPARSLDFALLPGDNADDGTEEQFELLRDVIAPLTLPIHVLSGDHDFKQRSLDAFYGVLSVPVSPYAIRIDGHRCLFLDVVSAGCGGPDFRLGRNQLAWIENELQQAASAHEAVVVFMHAYPSDLREGADQLNTLLSQRHVVCVDMGHTHYNELANDGRTIFMATRSTGQIEEGPPGFSVAAIDGGAVSWRFKSLGNAWPCVLVTTPADKRLVAITSDPFAVPFIVRAKVFSDVPIERVDLQLDGGEWLAMAPIEGEVALWEAGVDRAARVLSVRARDGLGREDEDRIELLEHGWAQPARVADGSDKDRIAAWPDREIKGTQLGPNRNGKKW